MCIMSKVLIDTNVLVGFVDKGDKWHKRCVDLISRLSLQGDEVIILDVVMFEASFDRDFDKVLFIKRIE